MVGGVDELRAQLTRLFGLISLVVACSDGQPRHPSAEVAAGPRTVIDSILPAAESLDRFFAGMPRPVVLNGGAESRTTLARNFLAAVSSSDTAALNRMVVSRAEYGGLYYPTSLYSRRPYELAPDVAWLLNSQSSAKGARRLIQRLGGRSLELESLTCARESVEGVNRIASDCSVTYRIDADSVATRQLFSAVIERAGAVKFLSYAGDF